MGVGLSPKDQLMNELQAGIDQITARLRENDAILAQNKLEVDRLQQRSVNVSSQLKRIEDNFDTVPRQDIKVAFEDAIEVRTRLISMRSQLEKLQDTQDRLNEFKATLTDIKDQLSGVALDRLAAGSSGGAAVQNTLSLGGEQIVRIIEAQESERQRLANALHDGPAQSLTNFILQAEICQRLFDRDPARANTELNNLKGAASISFQKIREFIFDLRPMMLDDLGLVATVKRHTENLNEKGEVKVEFRLTGAERRLPKHVEVIMFRGLQQLIVNAREHLRAKTITVTLDIGDNKVRGRVEDNGKGFDPQVALDREQGDSPLQNLIDLEERVELVGGELDVYSAEGEGSKIEIILPIVERGE